MKSLLLAVSSAVMIAAWSAAADEKLDEASPKYREMLREASPAELYVVMGEELFRAKRGPKNESLEACDFGLGPGVVAGAHAQLPRYFADTDRVEDLESRLMTCMARLQGLGEDAFPRHGRGDARTGDLQKLAAYVASHSSGMKLAAPLEHPKEVDAYRIGERLFHRRAGTHDFSCATCHTNLQGRRVRLQRLAQLMDTGEAQGALPSWPAYRVAAGEVQTMQDWLPICYWAARHPQLRYGSDGSVALQVFMAQHAKGGEISAPSIKR
jgi:sulfur-oxidizing protein SoxA